TAYNKADDRRCIQIPQGRTTKLGTVSKEVYFIATAFSPQCAALRTLKANLLESSQSPPGHSQ
ncbi:MAG: hypothetical protein LBD85_05270, partial [Oscillospiraceae bacterium]|nr:hypothetical protein [Oscillospiraceae bacterium]